MDEKSKLQTIDDPHQDPEIESVGVVKSQLMEDRLKVLEDNSIGQDTWRKHCLRLTDTQMNVKALIHELKKVGILTNEMLINIDYQYWKEECRVKLNETKIIKLGPCDCDPCIGQVLEVECDKCLRIIRAALAIPRMKSIVTNTNENILMPDNPCPQCGGRSIPDEGGYYFCIEPRCGKGYWYPAKSKDLSTEDVTLPLDHMPDPECSCEECREWFKLPPAEESNLLAKMADPIGYWQTEDAGVTSTGVPPAEEPEELEQDAQQVWIGEFNALRERLEDIEAWRKAEQKMGVRKEQAALVWNQKVDDGELDAQPEFKALQERVEALEEWDDVLLREFNDKGILSDDIIYKMSRWVKDRLAMKRGETPAEVHADLTTEEPDRKEGA